MKRKAVRAWFAGMLLALAGTAAYSALGRPNPDAASDALERAAGLGNDGRAGEVKGTITHRGTRYVVPDAICWALNAEGGAAAGSGVCVNPF